MLAARFLMLVSVIFFVFFVIIIIWFPCGKLSRLFSVRYAFRIVSIVA